MLRRFSRQTIKDYIKDHKALVIILAVCWIYILFAAVIPFTTKDQLQTWDHPGHRFAITYQRDHLLPNLTGWNPHFYAGYPQGTFYAPLYHYVAAIISLATGVPAAMKLLYTLSVLILPLAFYFCARSFRLTSNESALATMFMFLATATYTFHTGGNLQSLFFTGLGANAIAMPLLFFYVAKLNKERKAVKDIIILSSLLAIIILTHFVVAMAAALVTTIHVVTNVTKKNVTFFLYLVVLTFCFTAFWLIPFVAFSPWYGGDKMFVELDPFITVPLLLTLLLAVLLVIRTKDTRYTFIGYCVIAFGILLFVDFENFGIPLHPYRFAIYFILFAMMLLPKVWHHSLQKNIKLSTALLGIVLVGVHVVTILHPGESFEEAQNQNYLYRYSNQDLTYSDAMELPDIAGRVATISGEQPPHIHDMRVELIEQTGVNLTKGLFVESAANGRYIFGAHAVAVKGGFFWGTNPVFLTTTQDGSPTEPKDPWHIQKIFDLFNITHVILPETSESYSQLDGRVSIAQNRSPYYIYQVSTSSVATILDQAPRPVAHNWRETIDAWFKTADTQLLARASRLPTFSNSNLAKLTIVERSATDDYFKIHVTGDTDVPILLKESYFPRWKAYANGKSIKVYEAAPHLILVYGHGDIEFVYKKHWIDYIGIAITISTAILLLYLFWSKKLEKLDF